MLQSYLQRKRLKRHEVFSPEESYTTAIQYMYNDQVLLYVDCFIQLDDFDKFTYPDINFQNISSKFLYADQLLAKEINIFLNELRT